MKKTSRCAGAILFVTILFASLVGTSFAVTPVDSEEVSRLYTDDSVFYVGSVDFPQAHSENISAIATTTPTPASSSVTYSYTFEPRTDGSSADVDLSFVWKYGESEVLIDSTGMVTAYDIGSQRLLWEGVLRGNTEINGVLCAVLISFSKIEGVDSIQAGVTIHPEAGQVIQFAFGGDVLTTDIMQAIAPVENEMYAEPMPATVLPASYETAVVLLKNNTAAFSSSNFAGNSQNSRLYLDRGTNRCLIAIQSHCYVIDQYYGYDYADTTVSFLEYRLSRGTWTNQTYSKVDGYETFDFAMTGTSGSGIVQPLVEDALSLLGVPTSTIAYMFGTLTGDVEYSVADNLGTVSVEFGLLESAKFDDSVGMPAVFSMELGPVYDEDAGGALYTITTSIEYRTSYYIPGMTTGSIFYTEGNDCVYSAYLPLNSPV